MGQDDGLDGGWNRHWDIIRTCDAATLCSRVAASAARRSDMPKKVPNVARPKKTLLKPPHRAWKYTQRNLFNIERWENQG